MTQHNIKNILASYGIKVSSFEFNTGDFVDEYVLNLESGTRFSKIETLTPDIARELHSREIIAINDIENGVVKLQLNKDNPTVLLEDCLSRINLDQYHLPVILGLNSNSQLLAYDLTDLLHTLVCGATKSGKSVLLRSMISVLLKKENVRLILIDPKLVEFKHFENSKKLYADVITTPANAISVLSKLVEVMEHRYAILSTKNVVNIEQYNALGYSDMPYIVVFCDELADLMIASGKAVEESTARLAAKARAVGIYLVFATQRASSDVVTGNIKVNFSTRVCFRVPTLVDSRVILDQSGGNKLKGYGDGLLYTHLESKLIRFQGAFISTKDLEVESGNRDFQLAMKTKKPNFSLLGKIIRCLKYYYPNGASIDDIASFMNMKSVIGIGNILEEIDNNDHLFEKRNGLFIFKE